ncbi:MAG: DUF2330 domain-containing protein, partial [Thermoanaerobaculia bacterium]
GNFQGRYVIRHPWKGSPNECRAAETYFKELRRRQEHEAETLASLTGWDIGDIRDRMEIGEAAVEDDRPWWQKLWSKSEGP